MPHKGDTKPDKYSKYYKHADKPGAGAKKRKHLRGQAKVGVVMGEFKRGTLHSGSGAKVKSRKQAVAIAMSEAGLSKDQRKSVRGSKPFSDAEVKAGMRHLETMDRGTMMSGRFTEKMPAHSMVMQVRKAQARKYK